MDWKLLLGILIGLTTSVLGNLVTPFIKSSWGTLLMWQKRGYHNTLRQQINVLDKRRDTLILRETESPKDFFLYFLQWFLAIFTLFALASGCAFVGFTAQDVTPRARVYLLNAALVFLLSTVILGIVMLSEAFSLTSTRIRNSVKTIDKEKAKLITKLPPSI